MALPKPITRTDYYLSKIAGEYQGSTPKPIQRKDFYLAKIAGDYTGTLPKPITRQDIYLAKIAGDYSQPLPKPITRIDYLLSAIAGAYEGNLPSPITREEIYLTAIANQSNYVTKTVQGTSILITDSVKAPLEGLKLFGKSTQDGTPSPENPVPIVSAGDSGQIDVGVYGGNLMPTIESFDETSMNGVDIYIRENGLIETSGNYESYAQFICKKPFELPKGHYRLYGRQGYQLRSPDGHKIYVMIKEGKSFADFELEENTVLEFRVTIHSQSYLGIARPYTTLAFNLPYEPYTHQSLPYPTPNGLPGIPVSSGGNYTDESGQQWVCDEVDFGRGVYVRRVFHSEVNENSIIAMRNYQNNYRFDVRNDSSNSYPGGRIGTGICNVFSVGKYPVENNSHDNMISCYLTGGVFFRADQFESVDALMGFLQEQQILYDYILMEPEETPLTPEILSAYAALHTNCPTTTVMNDAGTGMEATYKAKPTSAYRMKRK